MLALTFADAQAEAEWITDKIDSMRGLAFADGDGAKRGLAWSDFAVLLRSVKRNAQPIVDALEDRGIPYVVSGMTGLFDTLEAHAASGIFRRLVDEIDSEELRRLWTDAELGLTKADLDRGVELLEDRQSPDPGKRFAVYNLQRVYLDFLDAVELREEKVPIDRGEVVYYNLGKFSQILSDYEAIHFHSKPEEKYKSFVGFLTYQAPNYYPEGGQDEAYTVPNAVRIMTVHQAKGMEFPAVFIPALQRNRFPSKKQHNRVWDYLPERPYSMPTVTTPPRPTSDVSCMSPSPGQRGTCSVRGLRTQATASTKRRRCFSRS